MHPHCGQLFLSLRTFDPGSVNQRETVDDKETQLSVTVLDLNFTFADGVADA